MKGALHGIRVVDFSTMLPGPMATLFLADAGAEVLKIERPLKGEEMCSYPPFWDEDAANFHMLNRGKQGLTLDLKSVADRERLMPLIETADIVVEQFRPDVMARLGLGYDDLRAVKPDIIYCSITGYGQTGPKRRQAGHDLNFQGDSGILALGLGPSATPVIPPAFVADIAGGTYPALVNILLALVRRDRTGEGAYLDIAMAENLLPFAYWAHGQSQITGDRPGGGETPVIGGTPRYRLYSAADGRFIAVAAIEQKFWEMFCETIGLNPEARNDALDPSRTSENVAAIIGSRSGSHWEEVFGQTDCCCTIVKTVAEAMSDSHFKERGIFSARIQNAHGAEMSALPTTVCKIFRDDETAAARAPALGADIQLYTSSPLADGSRPV